MRTNNRPVVVMVSCGSLPEAETVIDKVIGFQLAVSAQTWPIKSKYWWEGEIVEKEEHAVLIKTSSEMFSEICDVVKEVMSYDLPSLVSLPCDMFIDGYAEWINAHVGF